MSQERPTILVLHTSSIDPTDFLQRLSGTSTSESQTSSSSSPTNKAPDDDDDDDDDDDPNSSNYSSASIPWEIDNKYYSASVTFQAYPQEIFDVSQAERVGVVMYLCNGPLNSLPPVLIRVMAEPRDIALAIRLKSSDESGTSATTTSSSRTTGGIDDDESNETSHIANSSIDDGDQESLEGLFDEIGMEYLDENSLPEEDDERPISIEERVRQTLMTHMWPNMVRKPLPSMGGGSDLGFDDKYDNELQLNNNEEIDIDIEAGTSTSTPTSTFPVSFNSNKPSASIMNDHFTNDEPNPETETEGTFPGLEELKSQIMLEDLDRRSGAGPSYDQSGFHRLDMMNDDFELEGQGDEDWVGAEYAKLDDWLDENEDEDQDGDGYNQQDDHTNYDKPNLDDNDNKDRSIPRDAELEEQEQSFAQESQFEDDFADFAPFQSAPASTGVTASLDPTPLLLHLQNVREELAGLDEDSRRIRAGREVENVLKSLGLGGLDWEDDELEFEEVGEGRSLA